MTDPIDTGEGPDRIPITIENLRRILVMSRNSDEQVLGRCGQEWELQEWAEREGYEISGSAREFATRRNTPLILRRDLVRAVWDVQDGKADAIAFTDLERVGEYSEQLVDALAWAGGHLVTVREGVQVPRDESEDQYIGRLEETVRMAQDRRRITQRLARGKAARAAEGQWTGGGERLHARYGYRLLQDATGNRGKRYQPIPDQQTIITRLIDAAPRWQRICDDLNRERIPGPTGKEWERSAARKIAVREAKIRANTHGGLVLVREDRGRCVTADTGGAGRAAGMVRGG